MLKILVFLIATSSTAALGAGRPEPQAGPYTEYASLATLGVYVADGGERGGEVSLLRAVVPHGGELGRMGAIGVWGAAAGGSIRDEVRYLEAEFGMSIWGAMGATLGAGPRYEARERGWQATASAWFFAPIFFARYESVEGEHKMRYGAMLKFPIPVGGAASGLLTNGDDEEQPVPFQ